MTATLRKFILTVTVVAFAIPIIPVSADPPPWAPAHGRRAKDAARWEYRRNEHRDYRPRAIRVDDEIYRGNDGRYYCRRSDGTTGLIAGAAVGGLIGNRLARGDSQVLGTILGAGAGALVGQAIDRDSIHCD